MACSRTNRSSPTDRAARRCRGEAAAPAVERAERQPGYSAPVRPPARCRLSSGRGRAPSLTGEARTDGWSPSRRRTGPPARPSAGSRNPSGSRFDELPPRSPTCIGRVMAERAILVLVGVHRRHETPPIISLQVATFEQLERGVLVALPQHRLDLKQRVTSVEADIRVGARQLNVDEERSEPAIGVDHPLEMLVILGDRDVCRASRKERPARRGSRQVTAPDLDHSRLARCGEAERGARLGLLRRGLRELPAKPRILSAAQGLPTFGTLVGPISDVTLKAQAEVHRREEIPAEARGTAERLAITVSAHAHHAVGGVVGAPRLRSFREKPVETDNRFLIGHNHLLQNRDDIRRSAYRSAAMLLLPSRTVPLSEVFGLGLFLSLIHI